MKAGHIQSVPLHWRRLWWATLVVVLGSVCSLVGWLSWMQREAMREQILARDAAIFEAVAELEYRRLQDEPLLGDEYLDFALSASQLEGVLGFVVYDQAGILLASVPDEGWPLGLPSELFHVFLMGRPFAVFQEDLDELQASYPDLLFMESATPLVTVVLPLVEQESVGEMICLVYWLDGRPVAAQFAALDAALIRQGLLLITAVAGVMLSLFLFAMYRQHQALQSLHKRTVELESANADLLLAAKTSALGSISAHLVHALKNPLAGLQQYLTRHQGDSDAIASAASMQQLLHETLSMLRTEEQSLASDYTIPEIMEMVVQKTDNKSEAGRITQICPADCGDLAMAGRDSHLCMLILVNLVRNSQEAFAGSPVIINLSFSREGEAGIFRVTDRGPGLPPHRVDAPFAPAPSEKPGGSGLGLPLSFQLARQMGGKLALEATSMQGTEFSLRLSARSFLRNPSTT